MNKSSLFNPITKSLLLLWFAHFFMDFFTGIWPIYKTLAQIDIAKAGLIAGISGFTGELLQIVFGYFCDRGHRKLVLIFGLMFASSIVWITFVSGIFPSFFLLLLLMIGSGAFHPAAVGTIGSLTQGKKGGYILIFASGGAIGLGLSQVVFTKVTALFHGHAVILFLPLAALLILLSKYSFPNQIFAKPSLSVRGFFQPIMHCKKPLFILFLTQAANQGLVLAFIFLLPDLLSSRSCHSWLCMGGGHLCFVLTSALTMVPAGYLCDKYGQKIVLLTVISCAASLFYLFLLQPPETLGGNIFHLAVLGAFLGIINPIIVSWGNRLVPESPSTVSAIMMGFAWCLSNLGPTLVGFIAKLYTEAPYMNAIAIMGTLLFLMLLLIFLMPQPVRVDAAEKNG